MFGADQADLRIVGDELGFTPIALADRMNEHVAMPGRPLLEQATDSRCWPFALAGVGLLDEVVGAGMKRSPTQLVIAAERRGRDDPGSASDRQTNDVTDQVEPTFDPGRTTFHERDVEVDQGVVVERAVELVFGVPLRAGDMNRVSERLEDLGGQLARSGVTVDDQGDGAVSRSHARDSAEGRDRGNRGSSSPHRRSSAGGSVCHRHAVASSPSSDELTA